MWELRFCETGNGMRSLLRTARRFIIIIASDPNTPGPGKEARFPVLRWCPPLAGGFVQNVRYAFQRNPFHNFSGGGLHFLRSLLPKFFRRFRKREGSRVFFSCLDSAQSCLDSAGCRDPITLSIQFRLQVNELEERTELETQERAHAHRLPFVVWGNGKNDSSPDARCLGEDGLSVLG